MKTKTVRHPAFPGITREVPRSEVAKWVASGWIAPAPKHPKSKHTKVSEAPEPSE